MERARFPDTRVILTRTPGALHRFRIEVGQLALEGRPALLDGSQGSRQRGNLPPTVLEAAGEVGEGENGGADAQEATRIPQGRSSMSG